MAPTTLLLSCNPAPKILFDFLRFHGNPSPPQQEGYHGDLSWLCPQLRQAPFLSWQARLTESQVKRGLGLGGMAMDIQGPC